MRHIGLLALGILLLSALFLPTFSAARPAGATIYLRRASFDPLAAQPAAVSAAGAGSTLRLAQLDGPPDRARLAALRAAGLEPLAYVPDNSFLVRAAAGSRPQAAGLRWIGALPVAYKLAAELDGPGAVGADALDLRVVATPDADLAALEAAMRAAGGSLVGVYRGLDSVSLSLSLPGPALAALIARDDIVWVEPRIAARLLNDAARSLVGVEAARQELSWLDGSGQIVAVTDTGLDRSDQLSADFSGRVAATFSPKQMFSGCTAAEWSDYQGHGTHVSGSILGSGALSPSGSSFAGVAPAAKIVVQSVANSGASASLDCLADDASFLQKAYDAGARVQNASWGGPTGGNALFPTYGGYDDFAANVDDFLYRHPEHLLVAAVGNSGEDADGDGVVDPDSISSPATAKNVLSVGASENYRPPTTASCNGARPESRCWNNYLLLSGQPITSDFVSDNPAGMAAFSSRGPTDDGRIKPELVAPGTNVISARSHTAEATYTDDYDANYAYESGTSMATPIVSGLAALVRQWLGQARGDDHPSAALVKALLLNGATDLSPGQYGTGAGREIPAAWPNDVQGWGRANLAASVELTGTQILLHDDSAGLATSDLYEQALTVATDRTHLRATLTWTDYPGSPLAARALVNDLDLEVVAPDGSVLQGNAAAGLASSCRAGGADRCNTSESVDIRAAEAGTYTLRVRGFSVPQGPQPFALVARIEQPAAPFDNHSYLPLAAR